MTVNKILWRLAEQFAPLSGESTIYPEKVWDTETAEPPITWWACRRQKGRQDWGGRETIEVKSTGTSRLLSMTLPTCRPLADLKLVRKLLRRLSALVCSSSVRSFRFIPDSRVLMWYTLAVRKSV